MDFYKELENILEANSVEKKIGLFQDFYKIFLRGAYTLESDTPAKHFSTPSYEDICTIVPPQDVPKRSNLQTKTGQINLLHAIAHIEYSAIDLALDSAYRFRGMPEAYYEDWLEVADDEIRHFLMIETLLKKLGVSYGDVAVHNALFEASQKTQTALERMAVVPRYLEANGLDATPMILKKLQRLGNNSMVQEIIENLHIILKEEISHVQKGDRWFRYLCKVEHKEESVYFDIVQKYYPRGFLRPNDLNVEARKEAGFSCSELNHMAHKRVC